MFRRLGPWSSQPQEVAGIDWTHPAARGLVGAWAPTQGPGNLAIQGGSRLFVPTYVEASGPNLAGRFSGQISNDSAVTNASALGFAIGFKTGTAATQSIVFSRGVDAAQFGLHATHANASYAGAVYSGSGYVIIGKPTGAALSNNTRYNLGARIAANNGAVYSEGVKTATNTSAAAPGTSGAGLYFASHAAGTDTWTVAPSIEYLYIWNVAPDDWVFKEVAANPWQIFEPQRVWVPVYTASSGSTGTSATTNAADTSSASGTTTVTGSSANTNANDTASASGTTTVVGTSATTNAADTSSASGAVGNDVTGSSSTTNAADTSAASGTTTVVGTSAKTNSNDTASANGTTTVVGTSEQTNANDTATASGAAGAIVGTAAVTNADDYASASGTAQGGALSGGWKRAGQKKKQRRKPVDIEGFDQPDSPARVEAPQPEQVETSEAIPAKDASTKERQPSPVELLMRAIDSARESAKTELRAEFKALVDEERQRVRSERIARAVENSRSVHERELRKADELRTKAIAKSAQEEEDAVAKLLMQRQKAARQAIAQAQKHLISLLNLKEPAL